MKKGYVVGERFFFTNESSTYAAKSIRFSRTAYIVQDDFERLLKAYPEDWEKFQETKSKIQLNEQIKF